MQSSRTAVDLDTEKVYNNTIAKTIKVIQEDLKMNGAIRGLVEKYNAVYKSGENEGITASEWYIWKSAKLALEKNLDFVPLQRIIWEEMAKDLVKTIKANNDVKFVCCFGFSGGIEQLVEMAQAGLTIGDPVVYTKGAPDDWDIEEVFKGFIVK